jgi:hypothetical protein
MTTNGVDRMSINSSGDITATGTVTGATFNATSTTDGGFQGIAADTATSPSFTWTGALTTGIWHPTSTSVGITTSGTSRLTIATDFVTSTLPIIVPNGTVTAPGLRFASDTQTGFYRSATNTIAITTGGTQAATFDSTGNTNIIGGIGVRAGSPSANASAVLSYTLGHGNTTRYGVQNTLVIDNTTGNLTGDRTAYGTFTQVETTVQNSLAFSPNSVGVYSLVRSGTAAGNTLNGEGNMRGVESIVQHRTADATFTRMENAEGARLTVQSTGSTALIDNAFGVNVELRPTVSGATINTGYLFFGTNSTVTGTFTNRWGVYIASPINNYFNGGIQVGGTATGTTSAAGLGVNTAPPGAGSINASGNITANFSDDRLKTRLGNIENALDKLCSLEGFYYEPNATAQALGYEVVREVGVSAQGMQKVLPEIVVPAPIDQKYWTIRYERALPLIIEAIKELRAEVDTLKHIKENNP